MSDEKLDIFLGLADVSDEKIDELSFGTCNNDYKKYKEQFKQFVEARATAATYRYALQRKAVWDFLLVAIDTDLKHCSNEFIEQLIYETFENEYVKFEQPA